jgi:hypothetical protein
MRSEGKPLEVWTRGPSQRVGWLTSYTSSNTRSIRLEKIIPDSVFGDIVEEHVFLLDERTRVIHHSDIQNNPPGWLQTQVPGYGEQLPLKNVDGIQYRWPILSLTQEEFDWVFDLSNFEPDDCGDPDLDTKQLISPVDASQYHQGSFTVTDLKPLVIDDPETILPAAFAQRMSQAMDVMLGNAIMGRGAVVNISTANVSAPVDSTLTVEKFKESMKLLTEGMNKTSGAANRWSSALHRMVGS